MHTQRWGLLAKSPARLRSDDWIEISITDRRDGGRKSRQKPGERFNAYGQFVVYRLQLRVGARPSILPAVCNAAITAGLLCLTAPDAAATRH